MEKIMLKRKNQNEYLCYVRPTGNWELASFNKNNFARKFIFNENDFTTDQMEVIKVLFDVIEK